MNSTNAEILVLVLMLIVVLFFLLLGPFVTIWCLNLLFGLKIPVTFNTWLAALWLTTMFRGINFGSKKS